MTMPALSSPKIPSVEKYDFPSGKLDPKAQEHLLIGKRVSLLKNVDEHKNKAIAALAVATILLVGGIIVSYMVNPALGSLMIGSGVILGTAGSLFFVYKKYLDPKIKIEADKDGLRYALFQALLRYDTDRLEGFDLLKKAILDRASNPDNAPKLHGDKEKVYTCVRQLKRQLEGIKEQKKQYLEAIESQYNQAVKRLEAIRDFKVRNIPSLATEGERRVQMAQIDEASEKEMMHFNEWKKRAIEALEKKYNEAVNGLDLQYDDFLKKLNKPEKKETVPEPKSSSMWQWGKSMFSRA